MTIVAGCRFFREVNNDQSCDGQRTPLKRLIEMRETYELLIKAPTRLLRGQKGYTLIEIVIVIVILGIIGAFTFQMVGAAVQAFNKSSARKDLSDQGRIALERIVRELRDGKEITDCSSDSITFKKAHPAQAADNIEEVKFELVGTDLKRVGDPNGNEGGPYEAVLASDVTGFQVGDAGGGSGSVTVDAVSTDTTSGGSSMTISHTTGSGSYRLMLVGVSMNNDNYETVTGITYNGTALSLVGTEATTDDARVEIWSLIAPSTGTHNVVITFSAALAQEAHAGVMTFAGVDADTPLGTFVSDHHDGSTPATVDIPSASGELVFGVAASEYEALTASSGQNERWNLSISSTYGAGGTAAGAAPTVTMSWDLGSADHWAMGGVSIKPSGSSGSTVCSVLSGISFDDYSTTSSSWQTSTSFSHTIGSGSNRLLVVGVSIEHNASGPTVSSITYNGQPLTKIDSRGITTDYYGRAELWYSLEASLPSAGTYNIVVNTPTAPEELIAGAVSWDGLAQQAPEAKGESSAGSQDTISTSITTLTDGALLVDAVHSGMEYGFTPDSGQTERYDVTGGAVTSRLAASTKEVAVAGSTTMGWTMTGANRMAHEVAAFARASSLTSNPLVPLAITLQDPNDSDNSLSMRTKVFMRNVPETGG